MVASTVPDAFNGRTVPLLRALATDRTTPGSAAVDTVAGQVVNDSFPSALAVGQELDKIGRTTGQTYGPVTHTCVDSNVDGTNITQICQYVVAAGSAHGDSGGPVFMRHGTTGDVDAIGILWGGSGVADFVFSLLWDVQSETGGAGAITLR